MAYTQKQLKQKFEALQEKMRKMRREKVMDHVQNRIDDFTRRYNQSQALGVDRDSKNEIRYSLKENKYLFQIIWTEGSQSCEWQISGPDCVIYQARYPNFDIQDEVEYSILDELREEKPKRTRKFRRIQKETCAKITTSLGSPQFHPMTPEGSPPLLPMTPEGSPPLEQ